MALTIKNIVTLDNLADEIFDKTDSNGIKLKLKPNSENYTNLLFVDNWGLGVSRESFATTVMDKMVSEGIVKKPIIKSPKLHNFQYKSKEVWSGNFDVESTKTSHKSFNVNRITIEEPFYSVFKGQYGFWTIEYSTSTEPDKTFIWNILSEGGDKHTSTNSSNILKIEPHLTSNGYTYLMVKMDMSGNTLRATFGSFTPPQTNTDPEVPTFHIKKIRFTGNFTYTPDTEHQQE